VIAFGVKNFIPKLQNPYVMKASAASTRQQSIEEICVLELESIYYPGYVQQMIDINPEKLQWELHEIEKQFSKKN
jgi:hypothetical protein